MKRSTDIDVNVGKRLKLLRIQRGLSQEKLSELIDVSFQQVQKYENGVNRISAGRLWLICLALHVMPNAFFEEVDDVRLPSNTRLLQRFSSLSVSAQTALVNAAEALR